MLKKPLTKSNTSLDKVMERSWIQEIYLTIIKVIYNKPTTNIKLNGDKFKAIPLKSEKRPGNPLSPYLFNLVSEVLPRAIRKQKVGFSQR